MEELEIIQHRQVNGLTIFINTVDYRTSHFHPEWELVWILDSQMVIACEQQSHVVSAGDMVLFSPNVPHEFMKVGKRCTFLCLQLSPQLLPSTANLHLDSIHIRNFLDEGAYKTLQNSVLEASLAFFRREPFYDLLCIGLLVQGLHTLLTAMPCQTLSAEETLGVAKRNARLLRLIQFVDDNYMRKVKLSDFAAQEGLSMSYLSHFIKDSMNRTFQEYVNFVRFNRACQLIAAGNKSMMAICAESGFSDYRYFSRTFQNAYGMTPVEYSHHVQQQQEHTILQHSLHSQEKTLTAAQSLLLLKQLGLTCESSLL